jgi:phosphohistidine phosphatase
MATTLLLLRHGKSDWGTDSASDHARPLAPRGRRAAKAVGRLLRRLELVPEGVLCSTAVRARTTVELAMEAGEWGAKVRWSDRLYESNPDIVLAEIAREPAAIRTLLVAGHEPVWSSLIARLIGGGAIRFPTAALACILPFSDRWVDLPRRGGELAWLLPPRVVARADTEKG